MQLSDVYLVTKRVNRTPASSLKALEKALGTALPLGYREYLTDLGVGAFAGFLHVFSPEEVSAELEYWRETGAEIIIDGIDVGTFQKGALSAKALRESFWVGRTDNGDRFVTTRSRGADLFVIPRGGPEIRKLRDGFLDPLACCQTVGVNDVSPWFEAKNGRRLTSNLLVRGGSSVVERVLTEHWGSAEIRRFPPINSTGRVDFGVRAIDGLVIVSGDSRGGHAVQVSYDQDFTAEVKAFVASVDNSKRAK